uniref:Uncharacterized protein n=1 Tax=Anopheles culicifacies TaxID=139723 RepID=A0A182MMW6_9DIPT
MDTLDRRPTGERLQPCLMGSSAKKTSYKCLLQVLPLGRFTATPNLLLSRSYARGCGATAKVNSPAFCPPSPAIVVAGGTTVHEGGGPPRPCMPLPISVVPPILPPPLRMVEPVLLMQ